MVKKIIGIIIIVVVISMFVMGFFIIKNKKIEEIINNKNILKIIKEDITTGSYLSRDYYISENKVVIKVDGFSEDTGKSTDEIVIKKVNKKVVEEFIKNLEENINKNAFEIEYIETPFGKVPNVKYPSYIITYKDEDIKIQYDNEFYKEIEIFIEKLDK